MRNMIRVILMSCAVTLGATYVISSPAPIVPILAFPIVSGVAAAGTPLTGTVSLKDSSSPPRIVVTRTRHDGSFSFDVRGLAAPFLLKVEWKEGADMRSLLSLDAGSDTANINPFSHAAVAGAAKSTDSSAFFVSEDPVALKRAAQDFPSVVDSLMAMLSPMFQQYNTAQNPVTDSFDTNHSGLDAMLDDVTIVLSRGNIIVLNKKTKKIIFSAPVTDIPSGNFIEANMPENGKSRTKI
jgi:hypothetical protein